MAELVRYRNVVSDSARWAGFRFRDGDVVVATPPKCGTTWMQTLCAMLMFDSIEFDRPLAEISPWLDMQNRDIGAVLDDLDRQRHRRLIKTHTPLDGIPLDPRATYLCVGRDPRDAAISFDHHMANLDIGAFLAAREAGVGLGDLAELGPRPAPPPEDPVERFWAWAADDPDSGLPRTLHHLQTFWDHRDDPNVALFHYGDLLADLPGQVRRLADVLGIEVTDGRVEEFAAAATFTRMKARAEDLLPNARDGFWRDPGAFFRSGRNGQWRTVLDDDGLRRYQERVARLVEPELAAWAHGGGG